MAPSYTAEQVAAHSTADSCWIIHKGNVLDVTSFVMDHPGGEEFLLDYAGKDVTDIMKDELSHSHSEGAFEMLDDFKIGTLLLAPASTDASAASADSISLNSSARSSSETLVSSSDLKQRKVRHLEHDISPASELQAKANAKALAIEQVQDESEYHRPTDLAADKTKKFLDLQQPLLYQLWNSSYSKAFYLEQVHTPRHVAGSARIFGSPFLEMFTKTPWWVIPIFWLPIITYNVRRSLEVGMHGQALAMYFCFGVGIWSLAEYTIHRFLFHLDDLLPDRPAFLTAHFLLHGIHHYLPMDRLRLVMPPALGVALALPLNKLGHSLFAPPQAYAVMAGCYLGYVLYDMTHYYLHHAKVFKIHFKEMKTYHLAHHYKNYEGGYGITSKFWDRVFGTKLEL